MIDRDLPVTEEELHAFVDGELPADRREAVAAWLAAHPDQAVLVAAWRVAGREHPRPLRRGRQRTGAGPAQARQRLTQQGRASGAFVEGAGGRGRGRRIPRRRRRRLGGARRDGGRADRLRYHHRRRARRLQALRRRGASSGRSAGQRTPAHDAMAVEAARLPNCAFPTCNRIGLKLVGGRLLPGPTGAPRPSTCMKAPRASASPSIRRRRHRRRRRLRYKERRPLLRRSIGWTTMHAYVVSGPADRDRLEKVTKSVYEQIDKTGAQGSRNDSRSLRGS